MANGKPTVVTLEEHYYDPDIADILRREGNGRDYVRDFLLDLGDKRIKVMDDDGIDVQVLGHIPWTRNHINAESAVELATRANDRVDVAVRANSDRLAAFATLPMPDPNAAADELERCVTKYGFKGAMIFPLTDGVFLDDPKFRPVFERAAALDAPLYIHPNSPHDAVFNTYYKDYFDDFPSIASAAWGFAAETAICAIRLILSGVFEANPNLKIILGHMGENIPAGLVRLDEAMNRRPARPIPLREIFQNNFWITTSGNFSTSALVCSILEIGVDRVLFSVDWPYVENKPGLEWMETVPLCAEDKAKILGGNAQRLLKL